MSPPYFFRLGASSLNGGRTEYNNREIDGSIAEDTGSNGALNVYPGVDAISQIQIMTSNYEARYGGDSLASGRACNRWARRTTFSTVRSGGRSAAFVSARGTRCPPTLPRGDQRGAFRPTGALPGRIAQLAVKYMD